MNLFTVPKIPMHCEGITHRLEKRKSGETKIVELALKIEPFTPQLAAALDPAEYAFVKRTLFKMGDGATPVNDLRAVEFRPPLDRQKLLCFATVDTAMASICLDQVKVTKIRARQSKDAQGWVLYVHVSFGPVDKGELEYVNAFYAGQRWITFEEAEPSLDFAPDAEAAEAPVSRPAPMWDDGDENAPAAPAVQAESEEAREVGSRATAKRGTKKATRKHDPDAEAKAQTTAGKAASTVAH